MSLIDEKIAELEAQLAVRRLARHTLDAIEARQALERRRAEWLQTVPETVA